MIKALLTVDDIKSFIYNCIHEDIIIVDRKYLNDKGISNYYINKYINSGMPYIGKRKRPKFDYNKIKKWLNDYYVNNC